MKTPSRYTEIAFRSLVASILATTLLAVTPIAIAEEPQKTSSNPSEKSNADIVKESQARAAKDKAKKDQKKRQASNKRKQELRKERMPEEDIKDDIQDRQDQEQGITQEKHKPSTNNVRAQSAKAKAIKTHIQTLHQQISDIYGQTHDVIYDNTKPQNERNQESKKLLDRAKALEKELKKADEQYKEILSSTSVLN